MKSQKSKQDLPPIPVVYAPADNIVMRVIPELAAEIGFNESIVFLQIAFWIKQSKTYVDGRYWTYQSLRDMQKKAFGFWSIMTTKRTVDSLAKKGLIIIDNHNKRKGDDTQWFALHIENVSKLRSVVVIMEAVEGGVSKCDSLSQNDTGVYQNVTTLPENTTRDNTEKNTTPAPNGGVKPLTPMVLMKNAIKNAFYPDKTDKQLTKGEWGTIQAAAKELIEAEAKPDDIAALYAYCKRSFKVFSPMALSTNLNNWRNTLPKAPAPRAAAPALTPEQIAEMNAELDRLAAPKPIYGETEIPL